MSVHKADIVVFGAGIAGLWAFNRLKRAGYNALLLESNRIGCGQTIASQGILHSGLKYAIAGKVNKLAKSISEMPRRWREALQGRGPVDISSARISASSQYMLIPGGVVGRIVKVVTKKTLGENVGVLDKKEWPPEIERLGFAGSVVYMNELVLDVPSLLRALAEPYRESVRKIDWPHGLKIRPDDNGSIAGLKVGAETIEARCYLFTGAGWNHQIAGRLGHDRGMHVRYRPLLQGMIKDAPCELYAHCVGLSEKPIVTVTTHSMPDGTRVWYLGAEVAERSKDADPNGVYEAAVKAFRKYMPAVDLSEVFWAVWPVDRVEGKSNTAGWMPDLPVLHTAGNAVYCWPTKMTFAPLVGDEIISLLTARGIAPSGSRNDWGFLPDVSYSKTPWEQAQWTKGNLAKRT